MTYEEAQKLCEIIPRSAYSHDYGSGRTANYSYVDQLKATYLGFNFRVILDRSGERSRWVLTIDDNDPREHYFDRLGGSCIHCGKTARELSVEHDESNTDEEELIDALSKRA